VHPAGLDDVVFVGDAESSERGNMDADVIVVGAGPVGLMLAGELRLGGAHVVVLERLAAPTTESRASTLHARTMELFDQRGLLDRLGRPPSQRTGHFGGIPLDFGGLPTRYPAQFKVLQTRVEELLAQWAIALGTDLRREHDVRELEVGDDRVRVHAQGPACPVTLTARYVVGCDGEDSTIRRLAGIEFPGVAATCELLRADVVGIDVPDRRFERLANGLAISSRRPDGVTRVMVSTFDPPTWRRAHPPAFEEICKVWEFVTGEDIRHGTPIWCNAFDNASHLALHYRRGRVLLAGDAAHRQMPSGGQAVNFGIQDAANLGWKLAAEVTGPAPEGLLDTYHDERHEVGMRVLGNIEVQGLLLLGGPEVEPTRSLLAELIRYPVVNDRLASMISGIDVRYGTDAHPLTGARVPYVELDIGAARVSTTELLRPGRGVLLDLSGAPERHDLLRDRVARSRTRLDLVAATAPARGPFAGLDTVLLRPDGYVAWVGDRDSDPQPKITRWFGCDPQ
jgi:2-polyprenyl-6-methoxyphenol hydroxylase-like FAD-dependent oxidoreductase